MNKKRKRTKAAIMMIVIGVIALGVTMMISIAVGAAKIPMEMIIEALTNFNPEQSRHLLIMDMRIPRVITAALVGTALAVSGAVMQGMTRNPLADSGLMGLSAGAGFAVAVAFAFLSGISYLGMVFLTFIGAGLGAVLVYGISGLVPGGNKPLKLILSGAAVSTLLSALSQGIALATDVAQNVTFWTMGNVRGASWLQIKIAAPIIILATIMAIVLSKQISIVNMGDEVALSLGVNTQRVKLVGTIIVVLLAGTSVALAGMIVFVGILVPHFCRFILGPDYRLIIPVSSIMGALLVVMADIGAKTFNAPSELPVGAIIALIGVPVFLYFARKKRS